MNDPVTKFYLKYLKVTLCHKILSCKLTQKILPAANDYISSGGQNKANHTISSIKIRS